MRNKGESHERASLTSRICFVSSSISTLKPGCNISEGSQLAEGERGGGGDYVTTKRTMDYSEQ